MNESASPVRLSVVLSQNSWRIIVTSVESLNATPQTAQNTSLFYWFIPALAGSLVLEEPSI